MNEAVRDLIGCADTAAGDLWDLAEEAEGFVDPGALALFRDASTQLTRAVDRCRAALEAALSGERA